MAEHAPVRLVANEQPRLAREFQDLPTTAWAAPSRCEGWNNARVVSHLAYTAPVYRDSIVRALHGDSAPPPGPKGRRLTNEEALSHAAAGEQTLAEQAPDDVLRAFSRSGDDLTATFERLSPTDLDLSAWHCYGN